MYQRLTIFRRGGACLHAIIYAITYSILEQAPIRWSPPLHVVMNHCFVPCTRLKSTVMILSLLITVGYGGFCSLNHIL